MGDVLRRIPEERRSSLVYLDTPEGNWTFILDSARIEGKRTTKRAVHLFGGKTFCQCGTKMYVLSNSPKYTCQKCRNKIPADDLEVIFREQLKEFFLSSDELAQYLDQADVVPYRRTQLDEEG